MLIKFISFYRTKLFFTITFLLTIFGTVRTLHLWTKDPPIGRNVNVKMFGLIKRNNYSKSNYFRPNEAARRNRNVNFDYPAHHQAVVVRSTD